MDILRYRRIKAGLAERGISVASVARRLGVGGTAVTNVITGRSQSARIERAVARRLGVPVRELFPEHKPSRRVRTSPAKV